MICRAATLLLFSISMSTSPAQEQLGSPKLQSQLVNLDSEEGMKMLKDSGSSTAFFRLVRYFNPQKNLAYCGVASSVMVLNALPVPKPKGGSHGDYPFYTQENFFNSDTKAIKTAEKVATEGMSLQELANLLNVFPGVAAEKFSATGSSLKEFRSLASAHLKSTDAYVLVNYLRKAIGQKTGGHISPLGAYHEGTDSFLILDVSQYKYSPVWVGAEVIWKAMLEKDSQDGISRGFVIVRAK